MTIAMGFADPNLPLNVLAGLALLAAALGFSGACRGPAPEGWPRGALLLGILGALGAEGYLRAPLAAGPWLIFVLAAIGVAWRLAPAQPAGGTPLVLAAGHGVVGTATWFVLDPVGNLPWHPGNLAALLGFAVLAWREREA